MDPWPLQTCSPNSPSLRKRIATALERQVPVSAGMVPTDTEWCRFHAFNERNALDVPMFAAAIQRVYDQHQPGRDGLCLACATKCDDQDRCATVLVMEGE